MEDEYEKLGQPEEYAAVMELFRAMNTEIVEANLPRPGAAYKQLYDLRAKILAERKEKGVQW